MSMPAFTAAACPRCHAPLPDGALRCPNCGLFTHSQRLAKLSSEALGLETINPWAAASIWQQVLTLVPTDAPQAEQVRQRIAALSAGTMPTEPMAAPQPNAPLPRYAPRQTREDPLPVALLKTGGSMALSIVVYAALLYNDTHEWNPALEFAALFVVLMLVHEMGHVIANRFYGLSASPPIFIPFLGAVINLRQRPPDAKAEAIVGIGGPILGTVGAVVAYLYALQTHSEMVLAAAHFGFLLNLFNLLPVPPLDGGRVTAAVSPWIWMLGLGGLVALFIYDWTVQHYFNFILVLVLLYAFPRIRATLQGRERHSPYYQISRTASWTIAAVYLALGAALLVLYLQTAHAGFGGM